MLGRNVGFDTCVLRTLEQAINTHREETSIIIVMLTYCNCTNPLLGYATAYGDDRRRCCRQPDTLYVIPI